MSELIIVNDSNFELEVLGAQGPVLVDLGANWCGPCKRQLPIIEEFAAKHVGKVKVVSIDTDDAPIAVAKLGIRSVPTILVFENGKRVGMKVGLTTLSELNVLLADKAP